MNKLDENSIVGVVIGRFQTPYLHEGHIGLLNHVTNKHNNVIVFIGVPKIQNTNRNPLDFPTRRRLIQEQYPKIIVLPLEDNRCDEKWSQGLDNAIRTIYPERSALLYGGRDCFIPHYHGRHVTEEIKSIQSHNATDLRRETAFTVLDNEDFRAGVIYGINKQRPVTYPTVDIVVANNKGQILLARKPSETLFRFVGGFVDRTDENYEMAARRELTEETQLSALEMHYITSQKIEDWRYAREDSGIMTTLFLTYDWDQMGVPTASDDIAEVKYFDLKDLFETETEINLGDGHVPTVNFNFKLEDKIVPEHIELMKTFIKKVVKDKLIIIK